MLLLFFLCIINRVCHSDVLLAYVPIKIILILPPQELHPFNGLPLVLGPSLRRPRGRGVFGAGAIRGGQDGGYTRPCGVFKFYLFILCVLFFIEFK